MNSKPESRPNPVHQPETSFRGERTVFTDDTGLPLNSPEVIERDRKRREELADAARRQTNGDGSS